MDYKKAVKIVINVFDQRGGFDDWWDNIDEFHAEIIEEAADALRAGLEEQSDDG